MFAIGHTVWPIQLPNIICVFRVKAITQIEAVELPVIIQGVQDVFSPPTHSDVWPGGKRELFADLMTGKEHRLTEGMGSPAEEKEDAPPP